jgi:hypothetical protein
MQKRVAGWGGGCFLTVMSSSSYPLFAARWRVVALRLSTLLLLVGSVSKGSVLTLTEVQLDTNSNVTSYSVFLPLSPATNVVRFNFVNLTLQADADAVEFVNVSQLSPTLFSGSLVSIRARVTLNSYVSGPSAPADQSTATDLTVYIAPTSGSDPSDRGSFLQLGGGSGLDPGSPLKRRWWDPTFDPQYDQSFDLTYFLSEADRSPPVPVPSFTLGGGTDPVIWLGHGFTGDTPSATWSGFVDFTFASSGGSGVPDASRTALLLAPGTLLLLGLAGRSRRRS